PPRSTRPGHCPGSAPRAPGFARPPLLLYVAVVPVCASPRLIDTSRAPVPACGRSRASTRESSAPWRLSYSLLLPARAVLLSGIRCPENLPSRGTHQLVAGDRRGSGDVEGVHIADSHGDTGPDVGLVEPPAGQPVPFRAEKQGVLAVAVYRFRQRHRVRGRGERHQGEPGRSEEHTSELQSRENLGC